MEEKINNTKPKSLRIGEEDLKKFKAYAEEMGFSQGEAFNSLISLYELEKAKSTLSNKANNIDTFRNTINSLLVFYVNALEENVQAEERIRQEFSKMLDTKENTIQIFQNKLNESNVMLEEFKACKEQQNKAINNYENEIKIFKQNINDKQSQIETLSINNNILQEQLIECKEYKKEYKSLEEELKILEKKYKSSEGENSKYINEVNILEEKLKNANDMINFYKEQLKNKEDEIKENRAYSNSKEAELKQEIIVLKTEHKEELAKLEKDYEQRLKDSTNKTRTRQSKTNNRKEENK